jgi:CRISPR/Cas system type I-B associated protein Csh2 (Cas7 group RAMP superfamily)
MVTKMDFLVPVEEEIFAEAGHSTYKTFRALRDRITVIYTMVAKQQEKETEMDKEIASLRKALTRLAEKVNKNVI